MTTRTQWRAALASGAAAWAPLVSGCTTAARESGTVHRVARGRSRPGAGRRRTSTRPARPRTPAPPRSSRDFLTAMQANPLSTSVARHVPLRAGRGRRGSPTGARSSTRGPRLPGSSGVKRAAHRHPPPRRPRRLAGRHRPGARRPSTSSWSTRTGSGASTTPQRAGRPVDVLRPQLRRASTSTSSTRPGARCCPTRCSSRAGSSPPPTSCAGCCRPGLGVADISRSALPAHRVDLSGGGDRERRRRGAAIARGAALPRRRSSAAPSTSWPGRCARCPASSACGSRSAARRCRCPAAASTPGHQRPGYDAAGPARPFSGGCAAAARRPRPRPGTDRRRRSAEPGYPMRSFAVSESPRRIAAVSTARADGVRGAVTTAATRQADPGRRPRHRRAAPPVRHVRRPLARRPHPRGCPRARRPRRPRAHSTSRA